MKILKLVFQNFKSYGNKKVILDFEDEFDNKLVLLSGLNGNGKSTLKEVFEYAAYGRVDGFTLNDLPNRTNKALYVYIKFLSKGKIIEIERGISPSLFNLRINGKDYDEAGKKNVQAYIENELFEIPYHIFKNTMALSINNFKSFLTMTPKDKRDIIDRIFGFDILNKMTEEVKSDKKEIDTEALNIGFELNSILGTIQDLKDRLVKIEFEEKDKKTDEINDIKNQILDYENKLSPVKEKFDNIKKSIDEDNKSLNNKKDSLSEEKQKLITLNKAYKLYENDRCPTCETSLTTKDHLDKKEKLKESLLVLKDSIELEIKNVSKLENKIKKLNDSYHDLISEKSFCETQINFLKTKIVDLSKKDNTSDNPNISGLKKMLINYENKQKEKEDEKLKYDNDKVFYKKVEEILSNQGIKQMVINNILPLLNNNIDEALADLDVNFTVKIDNQFDCIVSSLGSEINVKTLSTGERTRVDYAILLSLIKLIKLQYPSLNIFFLDEIFSNIDLESIDILVQMMKTISEDLKLTSFLVSHSPVSEVLFDKKIVLVKSNTFSEMIIEDLK